MPQKIVKRLQKITENRNQKQSKKDGKTANKKRPQKYRRQKIIEKCVKKKSSKHRQKLHNIMRVKENQKVDKT